MQKYVPFYLWGMAPLFGLVMSPQLLLAQVVKPQEVKFETIDKVMIKGSFYPATRGKSPVVMILHEFGGNRKEAEWDLLARDIQQQCGFAVLTFDFRGHGDSTTVDPTIFWNVASNVATFRPNQTRDKITYKDIPGKGYYPMLINDIAAAKQFLDQQNDAGNCNVSNLVIIGSKESAALGSLFIAKAWTMINFVPNPFGIGAIQSQKRPWVGQDCKCAVWLSMPDDLMNIKVSSWLRMDQVRDRVPMAFFYGKSDITAAKGAQEAMRWLKNNPLTRERAVPSKLSGKALLTNKQTREEICTYISKVIEKQGNDAWLERKNEFPLQWYSVKQYYPRVP
ncbi:MAG: hypothetical protein KatS3mg105_3587 [Gemmatales bacterium]|nr:MAG: hypothetical protein KatS3mg105_3587 [Gemmatales bacterium]